MKSLQVSTYVCTCFILSKDLCT